MNGRKKYGCRILMTMAALAILLVLAMGSAAADKPVGGRRPRQVPTGMLSRGGVALDGPDVCITGTEYSWQLINTEQGYTYEITVAIEDGSYADPEISDTLYIHPFITGGTFNYTFYEPGSYILFVDIYKNNKNVRSIWKFVSVSDGGENAMTRMVKQVALENRVAGDEYQTAKNLHDWVMEHCTYDYSYTYYSADSLFLKGTGVCNSYARAYQLLAEAAGLAVRRVGGHVGADGHAWNAVRIDGEWYELDCTWDDDDGGMDEFYRNRYCFVPTRLIAIDHEFENYVGGAVTCTSLRDNFFIRSDSWYDYASETLAPYWSLMDEGYHWFSLDLVPYYSGDYETHMQGEVTAYGMSQSSWEVQGRIYWGPFTYDWDTRTLNGDHESRGTLYLPGSLTSIGPGAFRNTAANYVVVPDKCREIQAGAFSGMDVWIITIPDGVVSIARDAFDAGMPVFIAATENSYAAWFAEQYGYTRVDP